MNAVFRALAVGVVSVGALVALPSDNAQARGSVRVDIGVGGYYPAYGYHHHRNYYGPPPVVMYPAPPVVVYEPPPRVVYAPPPYVAADPAGPLYRSGDGRQCREYQSTVMIGGRPQSSYGTACLQADGTWRIVD